MFADQHSARRSAHQLTGGRRSALRAASALATVAGTCLALAGTHASAQPAVFIPLDTLTGPNDTLGIATGVSDDGSTVSGYVAAGSSVRSFVWRRGVGASFVTLPAAGGLSNLQLQAISGDGATAVGRVTTATGDIRAAFVRSGQVTVLPELASASRFTEALGVNADGTVIVGQGQNGSAIEAFSWRPAQGATGLGFLSASPLFGRQSAARGVSASGSVITGSSTAFDGLLASRWVAGQSVTTEAQNPVLPGGTRVSEANAITSDGAYSVGFSNSQAGTEAFIIGPSPTSPALRTIRSLGDLPGGATTSIAWDVSADGSVVVGSSVDATNRLKAFIWTEAQGIRDLAQFLVQTAGVNLAGWELTEARSISADGRTIAGFGVSPSGDLDAFIVQLGPVGCNPADIADDFGFPGPDGTLTVADLFFFLAVFESPSNDPSRLLADIADAFGDVASPFGTGGPDGVLDISDLFAFLSWFEIGC